MTQRSTSGGIAIAKVAGFLALLTWFGFIAFFMEHEQGQLLALQRTPIGFALVAIVAAYFHKRTAGKFPN